MSKYGVFLVHIFPHSDCIRRDTSYLSVFNPNAGKYGPEKTPYLNTFHAVQKIQNESKLTKCFTDCGLSWNLIHITTSQLWMSALWHQRMFLTFYIYITRRKLDKDFFRECKQICWKLWVFSLLLNVFLNICLM